MKFPKLGLFVVIAICMSLTFACGDDDDGGGMMAGGCDSISASYSMDVVPILNQTCAIPNCHVNGFINGDFTTFAGLEATANTTLENQITSGAMPPANTAGPPELTDAEMDIFLCWIEGGALDN